MPVASELWTEFVQFHRDLVEQTLQVGDSWSGVNQLTLRTRRGGERAVKHDTKCFTLYFDSDLLCHTPASRMSLVFGGEPCVHNVGVLM